jgi:hypothetical protein
MEMFPSNDFLFFFLGKKKGKRPGAFQAGRCYVYGRIAHQQHYYFQRAMHTKRRNVYGAAGNVRPLTKSHYRSE